MNDPSADVREREDEFCDWEKLAGREGIASIARDDCERVLADADALLAVVRAAQKWADLRGKAIYQSEKDLMKALAALPEHLKSAPNPLF